MEDVNPLGKERLEYMKMEFTIKHTWDGLPVSHEPVTIGLKSNNAGLLMEVNAPFFDDPPAPLGEPGKPFSRLWDYEAMDNTCCCCFLAKEEYGNHRLEFFKDLNLKGLMGEDWKQPESDIWKSLTN
uniref:Chromosome 4 open reading frame 33 n=1 Tax=Accipiter nisus TaxID=211598 RepID=A0A8B9M5D2_9AVES